MNLYSFELVVRYEAIFEVGLGVSYQKMRNCPGRMGYLGFIFRIAPQKTTMLANHKMDGDLVMDKQTSRIASSVQF
jgi:hypothetical protein